MAAGTEPGPIIVESSSSGPIVQVVVLHPDGSAQQECIDMTPAKNCLGELLGGRSAIIGSLPELDVVLLKRRDDDTPYQSEESQHKLPRPFSTERVRGPIVLTRSPHHFSLAEWQQHQLETKDFSDAGEAAGAHHVTVNWEEDEFCRNRKDSVTSTKSAAGHMSQSEEDGETPRDAVAALVLVKMASKFGQEHGRAPTQDELDQMTQTIEQGGARSLTTTTVFRSGGLVGTYWRQRSRRCVLCVTA